MTTFEKCECTLVHSISQKGTETQGRAGGRGGGQRRGRVREGEERGRGREIEGRGRTREKEKEGKCTVRKIDRNGVGKDGDGDGERGREEVVGRFGVRAVVVYSQTAFKPALQDQTAICGRQFVQ